MILRIDNYLLPYISYKNIWGGVILMSVRAVYFEDRVR